MKSDLTLLCRCFGTAEALYWLPLHRPLGDAIHRLAGWQACYQRRGLAFGKDRATVEALRRLTAQGLLATQGTTQSKAWKLTDVGALTAMNVMDLDPSESKALLAQIAAAEEKSSIHLPGSGDYKLAMAWLLIPSAGPWLVKASKSDQSWKIYQNRYLSKLAVYATPLLVMGYVHLLTDGQGRLWAMRLTPEGRAAMESWPVKTKVKKDDKGFDAWEIGYGSGMDFAGRPAPSGFDNIVKRVLPSTAWTSAN